jgi:hypothetical protein
VWTPRASKGLFIEELQSDRHQSGRDAGYVGEELPLPQGYRIEKSPIRGFIAYTPDGKSLGGRDTTTSAIQSARMHAGLSSGKAQVPDAPFRTGWPLQLFKRALRDAVADGKEWIGWTTGETQAARYDLSTQVDSIRFERWDDGKGAGIFVEKNGDEIIARDATLAELPNIIGKELTERVMASKSDKGTFTGLDLKVGGEGMKGFYDTMVPKDVAKYVKQWGAQVEKVDIKAPETAGQNARLRYEVYDPSGQVYDAFPTLQAARTAARDAGAGYTVKSPERTKPVAVWRVNITPQMREGIKKAGQALFVGGAAAVVAEDQIE